MVYRYERVYEDKRRQSRHGVAARKLYSAVEKAKVEQPSSAAHRSGADSAAGSSATFAVPAAAASRSAGGGEDGATGEERKRDESEV